MKYSFVGTNSITPAHGILKEAAAQNPNFIVMGHRGHKVQGSFFGTSSTSKKVANHATVPVVVIAYEDTDAAAAQGKK